MILIVEGADLVGKSTLIERLGHVRPWPTVAVRWDLEGDPRIETTAMAKTTIAMLKSLRPDVVFDRSFLSWWAYGPPLGHDVSWMPELIARLEGVADIHVVVLTASAAELERRYRQTPDEWFSLEVIQAANERFRSLAALLPAGVGRSEIDTTGASPQAVFDVVVQALT